jgi:hypothetical protein
MIIVNSIRGKKCMLFSLNVEIKGTVLSPSMEITPVTHIILESKPEMCK